MRADRVFDAHCHVGYWGAHRIESRSIDPFKSIGFHDALSFQRYRRAKQLTGVVVLPTYTPDPERTFGFNNLVLECAAKAAGVVPCFWVDPSPSVRGLLEEAVDLAAQHGVRALKLSPDAWDEGYSAAPDSWDAVFRSGIEMIVEYATSVAGIIQLHTGGGRSDIRLVERLVRWLPGGSRVHIVHMGGRNSGYMYFVPRFTEWVSEGLDIVCDTSGAAGWAVRWVTSLAEDNTEIASRVLFASDEPWCTFEAELAKLREATKGRARLRERILRQNAQSLYGSVKSVT